MGQFSGKGTLAGARPHFPQSPSLVLRVVAVDRRCSELATKMLSMRQSTQVRGSGRQLRDSVWQWNPHSVRPPRAGKDRVKTRHAHPVLRSPAGSW